MIDRELLERAAKAAGIQIDFTHTNGGGRFNTGFDAAGNAVLDWHNHKTWNPLTDDGDALRLAVKLQISPVWYELSVDALAAGRAHATVMLKEVPDVAAATRLAITRAAAAIGEAMP